MHQYSLMNLRPSDVRYLERSIDDNDEQNNFVSKVVILLTQDVTDIATLDYIYCTGAEVRKIYKALPFNTRFDIESLESKAAIVFFQGILGRDFNPTEA